MKILSVTQEQIEAIAIDYGIVHLNYGEVGEKLLGPTRGGGGFSVQASYRDIEFDGAKGKTKGMKVVEDLNAMLGVTLIDTSIDVLELAMPFVVRVGDILTAASASVGIIPGAAYRKNVTMFVKLISGQYKKITLYNALSEKDFSLSAKPKGESEVALELSAHWDPTDEASVLYKIEDVASLGGDVVAPTATTVPADAATAIVVTSNLTATFSEGIKDSDVNSNNFILVKASDGTIIPGALTYVAATNVVTFAPTESLTALTPYIWTITNVRDLAGNKALPIITNFTTA